MLSGRRSFLSHSKSHKLPAPLASPVRLHFVRYQINPHFAFSSLLNDFVRLETGGRRGGTRKKVSIFWFIVDTLLKYYLSRVESTWKKFVRELERTREGNSTELNSKRRRKSSDDKFQQEKLRKLVESPLDRSEEEFHLETERNFIDFSSSYLKHAFYNLWFIGWHSKRL